MPSSCLFCLLSFILFFVFFFKMNDICIKTIYIVHAASSVSAMFFFAPNLSHVKEAFIPQHSTLQRSWKAIIIIMYYQRVWTKCPQSQVCSWFYMITRLASNITVFFHIKHNSCSPTFDGRGVYHMAQYLCAYECMLSRGRLIKRVDIRTQSDLWEFWDCVS